MVATVLITERQVKPCTKIEIYSCPIVSLMEVLLAALTLQVAEGFDVLSKINEAYCDKDGRPFQDIRIYHTVILDDPFPDPDGI